MALGDHYDLDLIRNRTAELVYQRVEAALDRRLACRCELCVLDLLCYVLNRVTPRYTASILGDLHPDPAMTAKMEEEIDLAVDEGVRRVVLFPHHR